MESPISSVVCIDHHHVTGFVPSSLWWVYVSCCETHRGLSILAESCVI